MDFKVNIKFLYVINFFVSELRPFFKGETKQKKNNLKKGSLKASKINIEEIDVYHRGFHINLIEIFYLHSVSIAIFIRDVERNFDYIKKIWTCRFWDTNSWFILNTWKMDVEVYIIAIGMGPRHLYNDIV